MQQTGIPKTRWVWWVGGIVLAAVLSGLTVWAGLTVLSAPEDPLTKMEYTFVEVSPGEVSSVLTLNTVARWDPIAVGDNRAAGIVTAVNIAEGDLAQQGAVLFTVDLRPVVIAKGEIPSFRAISVNTVGPDVAQLQTMLSDLGFYNGEADGKSGSETAIAVKAWQKSLGVKSTGTVETADIVFVPTLPTRISLDTTVVRRGAVLSGGEQVVRGLSESPVFSISVTDAQAASLVPGTSVEVTSPTGGMWQAAITEHFRDPQTSSLIAELMGPGNTPVCGTECDLIPTIEELSLRSHVITVAPVSGLIVPSAALITNATGNLAVISEQGTRIPVTVLESAKGMSVVEGVDQGVMVQVPAKTGEAQ